MAPPVYLVDLEVYRPPAEFRCSFKATDKAWMTALAESPFLANQAGQSQSLTDQEAAECEALDTINFQYRVWKRSGLSENYTYLPPSVNPAICGTKPQTDLRAAAAECHATVTGAVQGLLEKTGVDPKEIDILITTCSIYCPTPSMASMVVNHFKMRPNVQSYSLAGMGCSNGVVAVNMVRDILKARPNSNALFIATEVVTPAMYTGKDKSRLVTNMLFRMGASAVLMSNKPAWASRAKYTLHKAVRVHTAAVEESYKCIWYGPDAEGIKGVSLGVNVVTEATRALVLSLTQVAPFIMTPRQMFQYASAFLQRKLGAALGVSKSKLPPSYVPRFSEGVKHFLLHAGGAKVLDGLGSSLHLDPWHLEPSRAVLRFYGNVSSASTWYALAWIEAVRGVKKGEKVLQVGVGSGVKCGICVWKANRDVSDYHGAWDLCLTPERRAALDVAASRQRLSSRHLTLRTFVVILMALLLILLPSLLALMGVLPIGTAGGAAGGGVFERVQQRLHSLAHGAHLISSGPAAKVDEL